MQDQIIRERPRSPEEAEQWLLWLLLRPSRCGPWHAQELARELGDGEQQAALALAGLHASGLAHVNGEFATPPAPPCASTTSPSPSTTATSHSWVCTRLIEAGHGAVVIDPRATRFCATSSKRSPSARASASLSGHRRGRTHAHGSDGEIADKALAGETFTEPHYLRQAQRYLAHAVRVMRAADVPVTPGTLLAHMDPRELEVSARGLEEETAAHTQAYLDSLSERQLRDLAGVRDRLAILAESELSPWLTPSEGTPALDLHEAIASSAVVYFRLDADRRLLLSAMLAGAIVVDLVTLVARMQHTPIPTVVMIDEFAALAAGQVNRLFGRARSAGINLILGTQELADLSATGQEACASRSSPTCRP
jgi:hypothetical protein